MASVDGCKKTQVEQVPHIDGRNWIIFASSDQVSIWELRERIDVFIVSFLFGSRRGLVVDIVDLACILKKSFWRVLSNQILNRGRNESSELYLVSASFISNNKIVYGSVFCCCDVYLRLIGHILIVLSWLALARNFSSTKVSNDQIRFEWPVLMICRRLQSSRFRTLIK